MCELLTAAELAKRLRIAAATVRLWTREGVIPAIRVNPKIVRYDADEVVQALKGRQAQTTTGNASHGT